jgi:DNA-binding beta-propeller fold protein YncE
VTLTNASQLAIVDTVSNLLLSTVSISPSYPVSLAVHPNGKTAYLVSNLSFRGIVIFDLTTSAVTGTIAALGSPVPLNVAFAPDGSRAYLTEIQALTSAIIGSTLKLASEIGRRPLCRKAELSKRNKCVTRSS